MPPSPLTPVKPLAPHAPASPPGRAFDDVDAYRTNLYDGVLKSVVAAPPVTVGNFSLGLSDVNYADPPDVTAKERKQAILRNETLARRLRGTLTLTDLTTNAPVATKPITIARVPKPTADGTMLLNGVEWTPGNQTVSPPLSSYQPSLTLNTRHHLRSERQGLPPHAARPQGATIARAAEPPGTRCRVPVRMGARDRPARAGRTERTSRGTVEMGVRHAPDPRHHGSCPTASFVNACMFTFPMKYCWSVLAGIPSPPDKHRKQSR